MGPVYLLIVIKEAVLSPGFSTRSVADIFALRLREG